MYEFLFFRSHVLAYMRANKSATINTALCHVVDSFYTNRDFLPEAEDVAAMEAWRSKCPVSVVPDCDEIPF